MSAYVNSVTSDIVARIVGRGALNERFALSK